MSEHTLSGKSPKPAKVIHYLMDKASVPYKTIQLAVMVTRLSASGQVILYQPLLQMISTHRPYPDFITPIDAELIQTIQNHCHPASEPGVYRPEPDVDPALLKALIQTGRCYWKGSLKPLRWLRGMEARPLWLALDESRLMFSFSAKKEVEYLPLNPLMYYDPGKPGMGRVKQPANVEIVQKLLSHEAYKRSEVERLDWKMLKLPKPPEITSEIIHSIDPVPVLYFSALPGGGGTDQKNSTVRSWYGRKHRVPVIFLQFEYHAVRVDAEWPIRAQSLVRSGPTHFVRIERNGEHENRVLKRLQALGLEFTDTVMKGRQRWVLGCSSDNRDTIWAAVLLALEGFRKEKWIIEFDEHFPFVESVEPSLKIVSDVSEQGWFNSELVLSVGSDRVNVWPFLRKWYRTRGVKEKRPLPVTLSDGREVLISAERAIQLAESFFSVLESDWIHADGQAICPESIRVSLEVAEQEHVIESATSSVGKPISWVRLEEAKLDMLIPSHLKSVLRDYQKEGVRWLQELRLQNVNGILADDMGLGKTLQIITHLLIEKEQGRLTKGALIIVPTTLLFNWQNELTRFAPTLTPLIFHGPFRNEWVDKIDKVDVVVTSYALLTRDAELHRARHWHYLILDESQKIKNPDTSVARVACSLTAAHRICMTGTPIENHTGELWSQFHFLLPGLLGTRKGFARQFQQPIEKENNLDALALLKSWVTPFILRRTKLQVASELPPKTEMIRKVQLGDFQMGLYERYRIEAVRMLEKKGSESRNSSMNVMSALLRLRQICCDPRLVECMAKESHAGSAKLELLCEMVSEMVEEGRKILIFSQFVSMLDLIEQAITSLGIHSLRLTGQTREREKVVAAFQRGEAPVFLISLKAGGTGLNLTAADVVIHYDPWWNPAAEDQATDRAYRIGQTQPVFGYRLIAAGTVEEKIQTLQARKRALSDTLVPDGGLSELSGDELLALLQACGGET